ncbi:MAG: hypothetical protein JST11_30250 [Acidobacteria bacterium]|nr:hypothetical protein [Acidobacteriota bacterium]
MRLNPGIAAGVLLATAAGAFAQYPTQYPPGGYPPTTYPPSTYPPSQYPGGYPPGSYPYPNTYPMPGGVPIGLPVPEIKLPKKKGKTEKTSPGQEQVRVVSVDGTLRRLREKDLLLEARKGVLRFRLLSKTRFENKGGEPVRDSLLHPGDQLSIQVSPDDLETALHVVLLHSRSGGERASAEKPVADASIRAPEDGDFGKPRTVAAPRDDAGASAPTAAIEEDAKPAAPPAAEAAPEPEKLTPVGPKGAADDDFIASARDAAANFTSTLPNYLVQQVTSRYFSPSPAPRWQLIDEVTADLAYVDGKEDYRNFRINGQAIDQPEKSGSWSTGEFSTTLDDLLSLPTHAQFRRRGEQRMAGRNAIVFDYTVAQTTSHWTVVSPDGRRYNPPYEGAIWVDQDTRRVLRIEQRSTSMPPGWPFTGVESALDYGYVRIEAKTYLLPARAENKSCMSGSGACTRNVIEFRNYRKFTTESNVKFGQ